MKKKEERLEKEMAEVQQQNKRLTEPLQKATQEVSELQKQLANYTKDKALLAVSGIASFYRCYVIILLLHKTFASFAQQQLTHIRLDV